MRFVTCSLAALVLTSLAACGGFLARMNDKPVARPGGLDCVRYQLRYRRPHLGNDQWGAPELAALVYTAGPGSYRYHGEYTRCPAPAAGDPTLVGLWQAWRKVQLSDRTLHWDYHEVAAGDSVEPIAMVLSRPPETVSDSGVLYKIEVYDAFFRGCDYWATSDPSYLCVK